MIVSDALESASGLSWEPFVMWRAVRQMKHLKHDRLLEVKAIDCLDSCEVSLFYPFLFVLIILSFWHLIV